ncbi:MarR family winged helix-turn-helix transcriptional regulator [Pseudomonas typographi]|uniref:Winged helix-turn-helix transcriptional regulator n=1 Tax=Pseudomonas typographi TaxID=2715964 RepID=A0ABR7Z071_9PSED|nr:MarR family winged helix-turn-helix transcriptional regulator [Pseudomonas typographi]MBD1550578.1 winged helix-turn-helix transcriptional regulator [Pseudomonas typographi]MBD1586837.1 winged helix-turn-helix transcriptional regulator [Pseudomonas typographi]MBD1598731.1 winged helix-turn-helix transcriptional regulator [Pseudomonas typographi]
MIARAELELAFSSSIAPLAQLWRSAANQAIPDALGLSHSLAWPLVVIDTARGEIRQNDLAARLGIEKSTVVRLVDQLFNAGLVIRQQAPDDRRANTLKLTEAGLRWSRILAPAVASFRREALAGISDDELDTCLQVFNRIRQAQETARASDAGA